MPSQRIKGQEISIKVIQAGTVLASLDSIVNFNEDVMLEIKAAGYLGEFANRFDEIMNGFGGDFEMHTTNANWTLWQDAVIAKAQREDPTIQFNVVRTDFYPNADSVIYTYTDVHWGAMPTNISSRGDYVKVKGQFQCTERPKQVNALP